MFDDRWLFAILALVGAVLIGVVGLAIVDTRAQTACLRLGYPDHGLSYTLEVYCGVRVDQTDLVVTLEQARARPRLTP